MKAARVVIMMASTMTNEPRVRRQAAALASAGIEVVAIGTKADGGDLTRERLLDMSVVRTDTIDVRLVRRLKRRLAERSSGEVEREVDACSDGPATSPTRTSRLDRRHPHPGQLGDGCVRRSSGTGGGHTATSTTLTTSRRCSPRWCSVR